MSWGFGEYEYDEYDEEEYDSKVLNISFYLFI